MNVEIGMDVARAKAMEGWSRHILRMSHDEALTAYDEYVRMKCDSTSESRQLEFGDFDLLMYPEDSSDATA